MRSIPRTVTGLGVAFLVGITPTAVSGQSTQRQILVSVVDAEGVPVTGLAPSDFVVREDGAVREVLSAHADTEPKQIALLVDTSEAASGVIADIKKAATAFVESMGGDNEISLISFGGTPRILTDLTNDPEELRQGVEQIFAFSSTASYLLDAVLDTAQGFVRSGAPRPVMVVMSTLGLDYSNTNDQSALDQLEEAGIPLHSLVVVPGGTATSGPGRGGRFNDPLSDRDLIMQRGFPADPLPTRNVERDRFLNRSSDLTGGRRRDLLLSTAAERVASNLAAQLRGQYLVSYARPGALVPPERIEVGVERDDLDARGTPVDRENSGQ